MKNVMTRAWEIARWGQENHGGKVSEYFAESLKLAWKEFKGETDRYQLKLNNYRNALEKYKSLAMEAREYAPNTPVIDVETVMEQVTPQNIDKASEAIEVRIGQANIYLQSLRNKAMSA